MKWQWFFLGCFFSISASAEIANVKLDSGFNVKYNKAKWAYQYIKVLSTVSPHVFEYRAHNDLKVIIQNETHSESVKNKTKLVNTKCDEANKFYSAQKIGSARKLEIKGKTVCFIEQKKAEKNVYQIIYPAQFSKNSYNVISFAWQAKDDKSLPEVTELVGESL